MSQTAKPLVIVALSGGVDSAVAALRLLRAGYRVEGLHMTNWDDDESCCTAAQDHRDARAVCDELGIALHHVDFTRQYRRQVFADFLAGYRAGRTPNPDVLCNREIKFGVCLAHARRLGADRLATGHYARIEHTPTPRLLTGRDRSKDQSYFLHQVPAAALERALFPVGHLHKNEVRQLANEAGLPVFDKRDSTGICFIGERPLRDFLGRFLTAAPGPIEDPSGTVVGEHAGLAFYTLGQRQGLGIGGQPGTRGEPWYVAGKDESRNVLIAVQGRNHPLLHAHGLHASPAHWIAGEPAALERDGVMRCTAKIRYRQEDVHCVIEKAPNGRLDVSFDRPQWAVTPGQYAVFYSGDECLGGAMIERAANAPSARDRTAVVSA